MNAEHNHPIFPGMGGLRKIRPLVRRRGEGNMDDIVRENRR